MKTTITEALSELNLVGKKIQNKEQTVLANLVRAKHVPDAFERDGGSREYIAREVQSIRDLYSKIVKIRSAIANANATNTVSIGEQTMTIQEWLTWKKDVAEKQITLYKEIHSRVKKQLDDQASRPQVYKNETTGEVKLVEFLTNVDYPEYLKLHQVTQDILERLDGQLSLKNATILVEY